MLSEIETAVLEKLQAKIQEPMRALSIGNTSKPGHSIKIEEILVGIESGEAKYISQTTLEISVNLYVTLTFKSLRSEESRRKGVYPILLAAIGYLSDDSLGLEIQPLRFKRFQNTTSEEQAQNGIIFETLHFTTRFNIKKIYEDAADELLKLALSYSLQPDDGNPDLKGEVEFG